MEQRLEEIRTRNKFLNTGPVPHIGCILLTSAVFFPGEMWIPQPADWAPRNLTYQRYNLDEGEGLRIWRDCQDRLRLIRAEARAFPVSVAAEVLEQEHRFATPRLIRPRLGQGIFRVAVTDAYGRACSVTGEHSLPVLEASHIKPYAQEGPHEVSNGLLLRADLHRLFDQGYLTVMPDNRLKVSQRLRADYDNGRTYYPMDGQLLKLPQTNAEWPSPEFLTWHNERVFRR
jgi:putative restriction endonuclease